MHPCGVARERCLALEGLVALVAGEVLVAVLLHPVGLHVLGAEAAQVTDLGRCPELALVPLALVVLQLHFTPTGRKKKQKNKELTV